jgi:hypothetical protein
MNPQFLRTAAEGAQEESVSEAIVAPPRSRLRRFLGPAPGLKEIAALCWGFFLICLIPFSVFFVNNLTRGDHSPGHVPEVDFIYFYGMGRMFNEYPSAQLYDYELQKKICIEIHPLTTRAYGPNPYSPFVGILFRPLARLAFLPAFFLWMAASLLLYVSGLALFARQLFGDDAASRSLIFCLTLAFYPFFWTITGGQIATIGFFALALAFREEDRQRPFLSGLALSLCTYKPTLLVLVLPMLLITRRYRTLVGFAGGCTMLAGFITAVQGADIWSGYVGRLLSFGAAAGQTHSFKVLEYYVDLASFSALIPGGRSPLGASIIFGLAVLALIALVRVWWKSRGAGKPDATLVWATTLTWTLLLNLYVAIHDSMLIVLSVIATAALLKNVDNRRLHWLFTVLGILILASSWITIPLAHSSGFQSLTVLFALLGVLQFAILHRMPHYTEAAGKACDQCETSPRQ